MLRGSFQAFGGFAGRRPRTPWGNTRRVGLVVVLANEDGQGRTPVLGLKPSAFPQRAMRRCVSLAESGPGKMKGPPVGHFLEISQHLEERSKPQLRLFLFFDCVSPRTLGGCRWAEFRQFPLQTTHQVERRASNNRRVPPPTSRRAAEPSGPAAIGTYGRQEGTQVHPQALGRQETLRSNTCPHHSHYPKRKT